MQILQLLAVTQMNTRVWQTDTPPIAKSRFSVAERDKYRSGQVELP